MQVSVKPGDRFSFQPRNNLASTDLPLFHRRPGARDRTAVRRPDNPLRESSAESSTEYCITPSSRFFTAMVQEQAPPKAPLRPWGTSQSNGSTATQPVVSRKEGSNAATSSYTPGFANPSSSGAFALPRPAVKDRVYSGGSNMDDKYANLFIQPKNRPELHRPQRINGPLQPTFRDKKPPPNPVFPSLSGPIGSAGNPVAVADSSPVSIVPMYSQPGVFSEYVDPKKAAADIKALLEGSIEDDDGDKPDKGQVTEDKSRIEGLNVRLLPHQVEGVEWMRNRELGPVKKGKVPKGGLLADDMGLGKTLQSISLILTNAKPDDKYPEVERTTLVVAPLALIRQWEAEIQEKIKASHRLKVLVHHGPQRTKRFEDFRRYDVVITTYQILVSEHGHCNANVKAGCFGLHWYRVILDEAHTIKNRNAKATKACYELRSVYRWCLTGTPLQNTLDELQSLVKFLRIAPYDDLREWRDHFDLPMKNGKGHVAIRRLHSVLQCFMKRRTKDILKEDGALSTGHSENNGEEKDEKSATSNFKVTERKVVSISAKFSPAERRFYDRLEQRTDKSLEKMMRSKLNYASALVLLLRLRQTCNHPKLVEGKLEKDKDALSEETRPKKNDADVDALADLLGGLDVETKHCEICGWELDADHRQPGSDKCKECFADLEYFQHHEEGGDLKAPKRKSRSKKRTKSHWVKKSVTKDAEPEATVKRKPRNRRAIIDSDDEEEEGEWIVSGDEQGSLRLGKAGGTDDEDAEGEGDTINSEDSEEDESQEGSRLESFIVDDGEDTKPEDLKRAIEASDSEVDSDDDSDLESISAMHKRLSQRPRRTSEQTDEDSDADSEAEPESESDEESDTASDDGISESELHSDSDSGASVFLEHKRQQVPHVLASAKIRQLTTILHQEVHEHKFIVFSQFTSMLDLVEPFLRKEGIRYVRYDGSMKNDAREAALHSLRHDSRVRVLLCSLRCGALGLNLTAASRVVILEPFWNPFVEEQAIDRVHRLTQTVDVVVYKLTVEDTVEERILELQDKKRLLAAAAIESGAKASLKLGLNEMLDLFKHMSSTDHSHSRHELDEDGRDAHGILDDGFMRVLKEHKTRGGKQKQRGGQESAVYGRRW
ncbi:SNF2 family N-terminal domain-containing protein [Nemania sp. FL0916]|nr:SNF2 family N-terminal domain-containing protein [Nemania sp. FL0916]